MQTILLGQPQFRRTLASPISTSFASACWRRSSRPARARGGARLRAAPAACGGLGRQPAFRGAAFAAVHRHSGGIPRRINRLCSRVLLYGALEEATEITGEMVETTAAELASDLGGIRTRCAAPSRPPRIGHGNGADPELAQRVAALEETVAKRERKLQRLLEVVSTYLETRA